MGQVGKGNGKCLLVRQDPSMSKGVQRLIKRPSLNPTVQILNNFQYSILGQGIGLFTVFSDPDISLIIHLTVVLTIINIINATLCCLTQQSQT